MSEIAINKERKLWVDALRGVAMILVVYGHCVKGWTEYFVFDGGIKMPLFFAISAYLFNPRSGNQKEFFKNMFWKLIVPWMLLGMFPYVHPVDRFLKLVEGKILWFMPCLIIAETLWFYIQKFSTNSTQVIFVGLVTSILGLMMSHFQILHYARVDNAFTVQAFFVLGFVIRNYEDLLTRHWRVLAPCSMATYAVLGGGILCLWPGECIDVAQNMYPNVGYVAMMVILGCTGLFIWFRNAKIQPRWLVFVGQNTLLIYIMHYQGRDLFKILTTHIPQLQVLPMQFYGLIQALFALFLCCVLAFFVNRYVPIVVGKKNKIKNRNKKMRQ